MCHKSKLLPAIHIECESATMPIQIHADQNATAEPMTIEFVFVVVLDHAAVRVAPGLVVQAEVAGEFELVGGDVDSVGTDTHHLWWSNGRTHCYWLVSFIILENVKLKISAHFVSR